jgi:metal-responsive CopG/Arc/MetJ family transcriptional regulator
MADHQPEFSVYLPSTLLRSLEAFQAERRITSSSAAIVAILDDYLTGAQFIDRPVSARLAELEGKWLA